MTQIDEKKNGDNHQQQILFSENELSDVELFSEVNNNGGKQVIFDNQDYLPVEEQPELPTQQDSQPSTSGLLEERKKRPRWLWRIVFLLFTVLIGIETFDFFINGFIQSPITTSIFAIILSCLVIISSRVVLSEWSTLRQFKRREKLKKQVNELLLNSDDSIEKPTNQIDVRVFCQKITNNLPCDLLADNETNQEKIWQDALDNQYSDSELLTLYSRSVLSKVDDKAMAEVARFSTEAVVLVALSPIAIIDMLIILWRNLRMINKISGLYGLKLGYWSRIKLIKQVFVNMVYAGASELIADFGSDMIGADLLGKLSGRLAQGLGAGMLTARLGVKTMQLCRPIPFENKPKLAHVRKEMLTTIKSLISQKT